MKRLVIIGAGGHGKVILDIAQLSGKWDEFVFLDDRFPELNTQLDASVIGKVTSLAKHMLDTDDWFVAIGDSEKRLGLIASLRRQFKSPARLFHPSSTVSAHSKIEAGTVVMAGAVINPACKIGQGCIINSCSSVDHDCVLGAGVHICPGVNLGGDVWVGKSSWVGIGSVIKHGIRIGENVTVGAGATVVNDIQDNMTVIGTPAKPLESQRLVK